MIHRRAQITKWLLIVCGGAAVATYWYSRPVVTITKVVEGPVVEAFYATGTIEPVTEYPIKASNAGVISRLLVQKGDTVKKDQLLAVVEDPQLQLAVDKAAANLELARQRADEKNSPVLREYQAKLLANAAMLENARQEVRRFTEIPKGGASRTDVDKAIDRVSELVGDGDSLRQQESATRLQLQTDVALAEAALTAARRSAELQNLRSPVDGVAVVLDRPTPRGTRLNINDLVMRVADVRPDNLVMRAQVDEENIKEAKVGQAVDMALYAFPNASMHGKVRKIYDKADPDRRTFEVDVKLDPGTHELADVRAGMTGELAFNIASKLSAPIAPAQAVQGGALYTVKEGRLRRVPGENLVGIRSVERIELLGGLHPGDLIVISSIAGLRDGSPVRTTWLDPRIAAGLNTPKSDSTFKGFN